MSLYASFLASLATGTGMTGEPLPYNLRSDWTVTGILFLCFLLVSYVLAYGKKHLYQQLKNFFQSRDRNSLFDDATASDARHTLILLAQTCVLFGFYIYDNLSDSALSSFSSVPHWVLLLSAIGVTIGFLLVKWIAYLLINWTFFPAAKNVVWIESFFNIFIWLGFLFFPLVLLIVYFNLSPHVASYYIISVVIFAKILLFYKCARNFFSRIYGFPHLILYFCALEILPELVLWKGILLASNV